MDDAALRAEARAALRDAVALIRQRVAADGDDPIGDSGLAAIARAALAIDAALEHSPAAAEDGQGLAALLEAVQGDEW